MEIVFLGTGGGRINLIRQLRWTGGIRINSKSANIHIDPGPGALLRSLDRKQDPIKLDAVIVTHSHLDHYNDAELMIEGMSNYALKKGKGIFIASELIIKGDPDGDRSVSRYHLTLPKEVHIPEYGKIKEYETRNGTFKLEYIKTKHDESTAFGFKLYLDGKVFGYTGDTELISGLAEKFKGCDYLIVNCLKPDEDGIPDHMKLADVVELLKIAKPKSAAIGHMGLRLIKYGPEKAAKEVEDASKISCIAPKDGQKIEI